MLFGTAPVTKKEAMFIDNGWIAKTSDYRPFFVDMIRNIKIKNRKKNERKTKEKRVLQSMAKQRTETFLELVGILQKSVVQNTQNEFRTIVQIVKIKGFLGFLLTILTRNDIIRIPKVRCTFP